VISIAFWLNLYVFASISCAEDESGSVM